jgi:hypothetical protein
MSNYVDKLQLLSRELFNTSFKFDSYSPEKRTSATIIGEIFFELKNNRNVDDFDVNPQEIMRIGTIFASMGKMLNTKVKLLTCDKTKQKYEDIKIIDYFDAIEKENFHSTKIETENYICSYHQEDLFTHLHLACLITLAFVIKRKYDVSTQELIKYATVAYLHDVGKPGSLVLIKKKKWTSFPFHGELGAGILSQLWSSDFGAPYTEDVWEEICRTIAVHMCGYRSHDCQNVETKYKWNMLGTEKPSVKENLYFLSFGDHFGALPEKTVESVDDKEFILSRKNFMDVVKTSSPVEFLKINKFKGIVVFVRGKSACGKSVCVKKITDMLAQNKIPTRVVERDMIICQTSATDMGEVEVISEKPTGELYKKYYDHYQENKLKLSKEVADKMKKSILDGIINNEVVIVNTMMSYFNSINFSVPDLLRNTFVISVDVIRNVPVSIADTEKKNISLEEQLERFGEKTFWSWLSDKTINHKNLSSISTSSSLKQKFPLTKPRLCFVVSWNQHTEIGYTEMLQQIKSISSIFSH